MNIELGSILGLLVPLPQENSGDDVFVLLALMGGIAFATGAIEFIQGRMGKRFPIPLIIYCHLLPMIGFVYVMLPVSNYVDGGGSTPALSKEPQEVPISPWPLYAALAPLPFVLAGRFLLPKVDSEDGSASI